MTIKLCTGCQKPKDAEADFSWSISGIKRHSKCKVCRNEMRKERYERNKEAELAYKWNRQQKKRDEARAFVEEYKRIHPCADCGNTDTMVLSFDHVSGKKKMDISQMVNQGYSIKAIQDEISLCEVVCMNCHYKREKIRRGTKYASSVGLVL
jgi:hypothetical protein